jgi:hypothetical protein
MTNLAGTLFRIFFAFPAEISQTFSMSIRSDFELLFFSSRISFFLQVLSLCVAQVVVQSRYQPLNSVSVCSQFSFAEHVMRMFIFSRWSGNIGDGALVLAGGCMSLS